MLLSPLPSVPLSSCSWPPFSSVVLLPHLFSFLCPSPSIALYLPVAGLLNAHKFAQMLRHWSSVRLNFDQCVAGNLRQDKVGWRDISLCLVRRTQGPSVFGRIGLADTFPQCCKSVCVCVCAFKSPLLAGASLSHFPCISIALGYPNHHLPTPHECQAATCSPFL